MSPRLLAFVDDLMDRSRISAARPDAAEQARREGASVLSRSRFFRDVAAGIANTHVDNSDPDTDR